MNRNFTKENIEMTRKNIKRQSRTLKQDVETIGKVPSKGLKIILENENKIFKRKQKN